MSRAEWTEIRPGPEGSGTILNVLHLTVACNRCGKMFELVEDGSNMKMLELWKEFEYLNCEDGSVDLCPECELLHRRFIAGAELVVRRV